MATNAAKQAYSRGSSITSFFPLLSFLLFRSSFGELRACMLDPEPDMEPDDSLWDWSGAFGDKGVPPFKPASVEFSEGSSREGTGEIAVLGVPGALEWSLPASLLGLGLKGGVGPESDLLSVGSLPDLEPAKIWCCARWLPL